MSDIQLHINDNLKFSSPLPQNHKLAANTMLKCLSNKNSWFLILIHNLPQEPNMKPILSTQMSRKNISYYTSRCVPG